MKKTILLVTVLVLLSALVLSGCGNLIQNLVPGTSEDLPLSRDDENAESAPAQSEGQTDTAESSEGPALDFADIFSGNPATGTVWGKQDEATKKRIADQAKENGYDLTYDADGGMTIKGLDGTEMHQNPDGTWAYVNEDGNVGQYGGNWPENEFTKLVPKPGFELAAATTEEDEFNVVFYNASAEEIRAYAEKLKSAGFNRNEEVNDQEVMGIEIYSFEAENADGYTVKLTRTSGISSLLISK